MTAEPARQPFGDMAELPSRDDAELRELMAAVARMPRTAVEEIIRSLCLAALGYERTGRSASLTCLAEDALVTLRTRRDPESEIELRMAPDKPASDEDTIGVEELLGEFGL